MEVVKKSAFIILALSLWSHLSHGQMNFEVIIDCDTTIDLNGNSVSCFMKGTLPSSYNYSDSIRDLGPEITVTYKIDSLCYKTVIKTEIINKLKYTTAQLNYISKYYENIVKNANIVFRTSDKKKLECKLVASKNFPMTVKFKWY